jgi:hypothetical protein
MTTDLRLRTLQYLEPRYELLTHPGAERELAIAHWLVSDHPAPSQAAMEWTKHGVALLPLGTLMSAVRLPEQLVRAAAGCDEPDAIDSFLGEALDGGPVICDPHRRWYYLLVPAGMPGRSHVAAAEWEALGVKCLSHGAYLGVPKPQRVSFNAATWGCYWSVPMPAAGVLCRPQGVARIMAACSHVGHRSQRR